MKKFTDIGQFRNVVKAVRANHDYQGQDENDKATYNHVSPYPTLDFTGTVKLHGTNAAIVKYKDGTYQFQSRSRDLTLQQDNQSFMLAMLNKDYKQLFDHIEFDEYISIYGEWCGQGIQKGIGISTLPKMFVIFAVKVDGVYLKEYIINIPKDQGIYNIYQFDKFHCQIDFNNPELIQNTLQDMTLGVEKQCPVAKYFGIEGIGEGIVWSHIDEVRYIFKVKGEKHQNSKVKTLITVDTEQVKKLTDFIDYAVTENRLNQGIEVMKELGKELDQKITGDYLRWVVNDIHKEEEDTIIANGIDIKKVNSAVSHKARIFWFNYLNNNI